MEENKPMFMGLSLNDRVIYFFFYYPSKFSKLHTISIILIIRGNFLNSLWTVTCLMVPLPQKYIDSWRVQKVTDSKRALTGISEVIQITIAPNSYHSHSVSDRQMFILYLKIWSENGRGNAHKRGNAQSSFLCKRGS